MAALNALIDTPARRMPPSTKVTTKAIRLNTLPATKSSHTQAMANPA